VSPSQRFVRAAELARAAGDLLADAAALVRSCDPCGEHYAPRIPFRRINFDLCGAKDVARGLEAEMLALRAEVFEVETMIESRADHSLIEKRPGWCWVCSQPADAHYHAHDEREKARRNPC
jgi:hypothetical protein